MESVCTIQLGPNDPGKWIGKPSEPVPSDWVNLVISGSLTINQNWGEYGSQPDSATFTGNDGQSVTVWGGKNDGKHFFNSSSGPVTG